MTDPTGQLMAALNRYEARGGAMTTPQRPWLTQDEAAERLGVSVRTVERLRASGRLRTFRAVPDGAPRFRVEDVDAVMVPDPQPATRTT